MITSVVVRGVAGYDEVRWDDIGGGRNLLYGTNGAGKSLVLTAIGYALSTLAGERRVGSFPGTFDGGEVVLRVTDGSGAERAFVVRVSADWSKRIGKTQLVGLSVLRPLIIQEDRQPQPRRGHASGLAGDPRDPNSRYRALLGALRSLGNEERGSLLSRAAEILADPQLEPTGWLAQEILRDHVRGARPLSCGQYDVLAILLEAYRNREGTTASHHGVALIDSPETFLHPAAVPRLLSAMETMLPGRQLIVATHAASLLAMPMTNRSYWLERTARQVTIRDLRQIPAAHHSAFEKLYGRHAAEGLARIASMGTAFLEQCASASHIPERNSPAADPQFANVAKLVADGCSVLDVGAGSGDFLKFILARQLAVQRYVGTTESSNAELSAAVARAAHLGIDAHTHIATAKDRARPQKSFDRVLALNVLHEVPFQDIANLLLSMLESLSVGGLIVCAEQNVLPVGERDFIVWGPDELSVALQAVARVEALSAPDSFFVGRLDEKYERGSSDEGRVAETLAHALPAKRHALAAKASQAYDLPQDRRARQVAFYLAQLAHVVMLEERLRQTNSGF